LAADLHRVGKSEVEFGADGIYLSGMSLSPEQIEHFVAQGFVKIEGAFSRAQAKACEDALWRQAGLSPDKPEGWTQPVIRLAGSGEAPFREAANTEVLHRAFDQLVGEGRWRRNDWLGTFVLRFPVSGPVNDDGWHIDASFAGPDSSAYDFLSWRMNVTSRNRALLMLFLLTDCGEDDAPTRIRAGSHLSMAKRLAPFGEAGVSLGDLAKTGFDDSADCPQAVATGEAGTVYLCHPFLVHAAQAHRGKRPRFLAQPPLSPVEPLQLERSDSGCSPVERAIRLGLAG
jgi:hypothetical protein